MEQPKPFKINWLMAVIMVLVVVGGIWAMTLFFQAEGGDPDVELPPALPQELEKSSK